MSPTLQRSANRHTRRWLPYAGAVVLIALITAGLWPRPIPVETARAAVGPLRATVNEEGKTRIKQRYVVSAPVAGQLRRIPFKAGAEVQAGETVLAVIDPLSSTLLDARTRLAAEAKRDTAVANVLDGLERVLLEIAHSPTEVSSSQLDDLRQQIESRGLLFKVRVMGSQAREQEVAPAPQKNGKKL